MTKSRSDDDTQPTRLRDTVPDSLERQLRKSLPDLGKARRHSVAMDLALALVRDGWVLMKHVEEGVRKKTT